MLVQMVLKVFRGLPEYRDRRVLRALRELLDRKAIRGIPVFRDHKVTRDPLDRVLRGLRELREPKVPRERQELESEPVISLQRQQERLLLNGIKSTLVTLTTNGTRQRRTTILRLMFMRYV
jgi:hypothetical protein